MVLPWESEHLRVYVDVYLAANKIDYTADSLLDQFRDLLLDTRIQYFTSHIFAITYNDYFVNI